MIGDREVLRAWLKCHRGGLAAAARTAGKPKHVVDRTVRRGYRAHKPERAAEIAAMFGATVEEIWCTPLPEPEPPPVVELEASPEADAVALALSGTPIRIDNAACAGKDPAIWYPDANEAGAATVAIRICQTCPARVPCLAYALVHGEPGIWGGTKPFHRARLRSASGITITTQRSAT